VLVAYTVPTNRFKTIENSRLHKLNHTITTETFTVETQMGKLGFVGIHYALEIHYKGWAMHAQKSHALLLTRKKNCRWPWLKDTLLIMDSLFDTFVFWSSRRLHSSISHLCYHPSSFPSSLCIVLHWCPSSQQPSFLMGCLGRPTIIMVRFKFQVNFGNFLNFAKNN
jgi:hypothetical protein